MEETAQSINSNTGILLSRNTPVAVVCGAAGFLGSHLVEKLLGMSLQVVGVDNFRAEKRENLEEAAKSKNFHLLNSFDGSFDFKFPRLDYLFIVVEDDWNLDGVLKVFKETGCRLLFISSIDLYNAHPAEKLDFFKQSEVKIAKFAHTHHLNARVLRLGAVFGPRMNFKSSDPINIVIQAAITGELQKEINMDFSTRALYFADASDLIVKSMLSGATALKIFDGVLPSPIKITEIKQILLDPVWYENKGFTPTELPPWPTPNLEKTMKQLNWKPKTNLVLALKHTLNYFKDHEISFPQEEKKVLPKSANPWTDIEKGESGLQIKKKEHDHKLKTSRPKVTVIKNHFFLGVAIAVILYALVWPMATLSWGVFSFKSYLSEAAKSLERGEFDKSLNKITLAAGGVGEAKNFLAGFEPIRKVDFLNSFFEVCDNLVDLAQVAQMSAKSTVLGMQALYQGLRSVTGEVTDDPAAYFNTAQVELAQADEGFSRAKALTESEQFKKSLPVFLESRVEGLNAWLTEYGNMVKKARVTATLLPQTIALGGKKDYLILLQNNMELRPTGGFIGSLAQVSFEAGKLKNLQVNDVYTLDGALNLHVEPPQEIKEDLGQKDWFLRDSNFEPDFPTSARQVEWFYSKESGNRVEGVIALDVSAIENLLKVIGPLTLADYNDKITADNLFTQTIAHAEQGFFPGSQAKKTFLTALTTEALNKIFFLPSQNWPGIVSALGKSLESKHVSLYLNDTKLFSYLTSQNWTGALPRSSPAGENTAVDFLAPVEANLGGNKANYYLDRSYKLETGIGKDGEVNQKFQISYTNRSPSDTWPGGLYKNRLRIYLPFGAQINRASWGNKDITKDVASFIDYGRAGYSMLLELKPKEQKDLVFSYSLPEKLKFIGNQARYRLDVSKQAGTLKDPFEWRITYPINYRVGSDQSPLAPQEQVVSTDLSTDRSFEITFSKSL